MKQSIIFSGFLLLSALTAQVHAADTTQPSVGASKGAPSATTAVEALKTSSRHGEWVDIALPGSDAKLHTWVVYPERPDKAPVVLVIFEIFGMSDWVRATTDQLAAEGFIAVAPDFLSGMGPNGGGTESLGNNVGATIRKLTLDEEVKRLDAARAYAIAQPSASGKVGCIGFCWGGGVSFDYATRQPALSAAVVCYGMPPEKEAMAKIPCPVLGLYGKNDGRITLTVEATAKLMAELHKSYSPHIYDGAGHGFFRQQDGAGGANLKAAQQGWVEAIAFLKKNLQ
jgi:carboxymethylenebutenolidase